MKTSVILLIFASITAANCASMRYEMNLIDNKHNQNTAEQKMMPSSTTEGSVRRNMQEAGEMRFQSNRMDNIEHPNENTKQSDRDQFPTAYPIEDRYVTGSPTGQDQTFTPDDGLYQSQQRITPSTISSTDVQTQSHMSSFDAQQQLFAEGHYQAGQQGFPTSRHHSDGQQRFFSEDKTMNQREGQMFGGDNYLRNQQRYNVDRHQAHDNRQFFENRPNDFREDRMRNDKDFLGAPAEQKQMFRGVQSTKAYSQGVHSEIQLSAFDNREHPLVIPRLSHSGSAVFVSGLKNLPSLPALVYNSGSVSSAQPLTPVTSLTPAYAFAPKTFTPVRAVTSSATLTSAALTPAHAVPYGHGSLYHGGSSSGHHLQTQYASVKAHVQAPYASVQQHLQTPYASVKQHFQTPHVRYVYSHLL